MVTAKDRFGAGIVSGAVIGVVGAFLFAPQSGDQFQRKVKRTVAHKTHEGIEVVIDQLDKYIAHEDRWKARNGLHMTGSQYSRRKARYTRV